jgi:hypothetical protein
MTGFDELDKLDEDRVYLIVPSRLVKMEDNSDVLSFDMKPTDDPDRYRLTVSTPAPKLFIKRVNLSN